MGLTKATYSLIDGAPLNALDYGADNTGVADSTSALQAMFTAGGVVEIPSGTYKVTAPMTIGSGVKGVICNGKILSTYVGTQDTDVHPTLLFDGFSGFVEGVLHIENSTSSGAIASDGVQFKNCARIWVSGLRLKNVRFGLILTTTTEFYISYIDADTMRGWQGGSSDNGGTIVTMSGCERGRINQVTGTNIYKAAVYFSVDGVSGDNKDIDIGDISVALFNPTLAVANGLALRSAVNVKVGKLTSTGGIAGVFCSREETTYNVDNVYIGKVYVTDNQDVSSNSSAVLVNGTTAAPVGSVIIDEIYANNAYLHSLFVFNVGYLKVGHLKSVNPGQRGVLIGGTNGTVIIDSCDMFSAGNQEILVNTGTVMTQFQANNIIIRDRGADVTVPINFTVDTVKNIILGSIYDETVTPGYSAATIFGNPASTVNVSIQYVKTAATNAASIRAAAISAIAQGRFYQATIPSTSTWPLGTEIFKPSPTSGSNNSWVLTTTGFVATANLA